MLISHLTLLLVVSVGLASANTPVVIWHGMGTNDFNFLFNNNKNNNNNLTCFARQPIDRRHLLQPDVYGLHTEAHREQRARHLRPFAQDRQ